jgi:hypothetical protein
MKVELSAEMIQALLALCDSVALRGPESKIVIAGAQAALIEGLRQEQGSAPDGAGAGRRPDRPQS